MKNSLFSISIAAILASASVTTIAGTVTIPNTFTAGTPAVAGEVNTNFSAVKGAVDGNAGDITTNAGDIATNTGDISTNAGDIATNSADISTNAGAISTNAGDISTNTGDISTNAGAIAANATAITALEDASTCPSDMVAVGSLCVDKYEASLWTAASGGSQISPDELDGPPYYPCESDGSDCGDGAANPIYAQSVADVIPAARPTWYQANQACANVGKRLPTTAEWIMAASGTDETQCPNASLVATGASPTCVSTAGVLDMAGNLWEWSADLDIPPIPTSTDDLITTVLGSGWLTGGGSIKSIFLAVNRTLAANAEIGFRCVR